MPLRNWKQMPKPFFLRLVWVKERERKEETKMKILQKKKILRNRNSWKLSNIFASKLIFFFVCFQWIFPFRFFFVMHPVRRRPFVFDLFIRFDVCRCRRRCVCLTIVEHLLHRLLFQDCFFFVRSCSWFGTRFVAIAIDPITRRFCAKKKRDRKEKTKN